jgi:DnaJ-class molecular chaperone
MEKPRDYYEVLGVPRDASPTAIKQAFRILAKKYHPDVASEASLAAFQALQAAYETLSDAESRKRYDESLDQSEPAGPLGWTLVRRRNRESPRQPLRPDSLCGEILLSPEEAAFGGILPLELPVSTICRACGGTGGAFYDCDGCWGEGRMEKRLPLPLHVPPGVRDGTLFQVETGDPAAPPILLTIHVRSV